MSLTRAKATFLQDLHGGLFDDQTLADAWLGMDGGEGLDLGEMPEPKRPALQKDPEVESLRAWGEAVAEEAKAGEDRAAADKKTAAPRRTAMDPIAREAALTRAQELARKQERPDPEMSQDMTLAELVAPVTGNDLTLDDLMRVPE